MNRQTQAKYPDSTSEKVANAIMGTAGQAAQLIQSTLMIGRAQLKLPELKVDRVLLFCFHYDPLARGYVLATTRLVRASGVVTLAVLGLWLLRFWRRERRSLVAPEAEHPS